MIRPEAPLRLKLDEGALVANWRALDRLSGKARAGAAVKADSYGLGAERVVRALSAAGCRDFFVAYACEAEPLLGLVDPGQLAVLHGPRSADEAQWIAAKGLRPVINSLHQAALWRAAGGGLCDLMVDTGINRLGMDTDHLSDPLIGELKIATVHSHLSCAEEDSPRNAAQQKRWSEAASLFPDSEASLANSAGIVLGPDYHGQLTRPGLALYGGIPCDALSGEIRQVAVPQAAIIQVRQIEAGQSIGYNATFTATGPMRVGVVGIGYADGYLRCWSGKGAMLADGVRLPVLGRVSMDMTVIDLGGAPHLAEGDWVEAEYDLPAAAATSGLSQYELLTSLGRRFSR